MAAHPPQHLRAAAGKAVLRGGGDMPRSLSAGASGAATPSSSSSAAFFVSPLLRTSSGLPVHALANTSAVRVPSVALCDVKHRDAIPGYRGFVPGKKAETVFGETFVKVNNTTHGLRGGALSNSAPSLLAAAAVVGQDHNYWNCPPELPVGRRTKTNVQVWATLQQETPWINGGMQPRDHGHATIGYGGHDMFRQSRADAAATSKSGTCLALNHTMSKDRDVQPFEVHRPSMPGYSGHIRNRCIQ